MPEQVNVNEFRLKLYPKDFYKVRDFYENYLGFKVIHEWDRGEVSRGVMFQVGETVLELLYPTDHERPVQAADVSWGVDDVHTLWERLKPTATILHELRHNSWGDTSFRIADPEGFRISFFTKDKS